MMHYGEIKEFDIANGPGVRVSLFVSGCTNRCPGCFQPQTWDFEYGKVFTEEAEERILTALGNKHVSGLTVLGGEPFEPRNQKYLVPFLKRVKEHYPGKTIWVFSGYTLEKMLTPGSKCHCAYTADVLRTIDVLVDGPFIEAEKDISLKFRGSRNQRIIDLKKTLKDPEIARRMNEGAESVVDLRNITKI